MISIGGHVWDSTWVYPSPAADSALEMTCYTDWGLQLPEVYNWFLASCFDVWQK